MRLLLITILASTLVHAVPRDFASRQSSRKPLRRVTIHLVTVPKSRARQKNLNRRVERTVKDLATQLGKRGYPINTDLFLSGDQRKNGLFFIHKDNDFSHWTVHVPESVPRTEFIDLAQKIFDKKNIPVKVLPDHRVHLAQSANLESVSLSLRELDELKAGTLIPKLKREIAKLEHLQNPSNKEQELLTYLKERLPLMEAASPFAFWHQKIPTTGLRPPSPHYQPPYPFIPHQFNLWELAPQKGEGVTVAVLDTGVAAFSAAKNPAYKKNFDLTMRADFEHDSFAVVGDNEGDPLDELIYQLQELIKPAQFSYEQLMKTVPDWIRIYLISGHDRGFTAYLAQHGTAKVSKKKGLTPYGQQQYQALLRFIKEHFHLLKLQAPVHQEVVQELLPLAPISDKESTFVSGHGSHTFGLIGGLLQGGMYHVTPRYDAGICGLAPQAHVLMFKVFDSDGRSSRSALTEATKRALTYGVDVLNMSLKITDDIRSADEPMNVLNRLLGTIPYVVAASGNDGDRNSKEYPGRVEAYPGKLSTVEFDVGAFGADGDPIGYDISFFSQYELLVGPKFVAPGWNILSSGLIPNQREDSMYLFMHGTSMAAPIMTGFVALMLGEFKNDFTKQQLLDVCYTSVVRLRDTRGWKTKTLLGALDMRTALFILHALKRCKDEIKRTKLAYDFDTHFAQILQAVRYVLYQEPKDYSNRYLNGVAMQTDFMSFIEAAKKQKNKFDKSQYFSATGPDRLQRSVAHVADLVLAALDSKRTASVASQLEKSIATLLEKKEINLFSQYDKRVQKRLAQVTGGHPYWTQQAERAKRRHNKKR